MAATPQRRKMGCGPIVGLIILVVVLIIVIGDVVGSKPKATYTGTLIDISVLDPAEVTVTVHVANTSSISGTPSCFVDVESPSGAYSGFDTFTPRSAVAGNGSTTFFGNLTVTGQGAQYVDIGDSTVKCT